MIIDDQTHILGVIDMDKLSVNEVINMINQGREFDLIYQDSLYQISHTDTLKLVASKNVQKEYKPTEDLFNNFKIDGKKLGEIWDKVKIDGIL